MKESNEMEDMRIRILVHLKDNDSALEQYIANDYLATLNTTKGERDLGSIRRAILDLETRDFIQQTNPRNKINIENELSTGGDKWKDISDPNRFLDDWIGEAPKICPIYIGITLGGLKFLLDINHDAINTDTNQKTQLVNSKQIILLRKQNKVFYWVIGSTIATALVGIINIILLSQDETPKQIQELKEVLQEWKEEQRANQTMFEFQYSNQDTTCIYSDSIQIINEKDSTTIDTLLNIGSEDTTGRSE